MLRTGIITTYLVLRLLVVSGFINIYAGLRIAREAKLRQRQPGVFRYCEIQTTKLNSPSLKRPVICQHPTVGMSMPVVMKGCFGSSVQLACACWSVIKGGAGESNRLPVTL
jgi:hypothetical protein